MVTRYLLDTCILVHLVRGDRDGKKIQKAYNLKAFYSECLISVVTRGEMEKLGREFNWDNAKLKAMRDLLDQLITVDINDPSIIAAYAEIDHFSDERGIRMGKNDVWIAAAAKATGYQLMTMDRDFDHLASEFVSLLLVEPDSLSSP
jgi:tRNA(fMet)-specific endonuclease VapC